MKSKLKPLYDAMMVAACVSVVMVLAIQIYIIVGRVLGLSFLSGNAYTGYLLAASVFFALPAAFQNGDHIRVTLILERLAPRARFVMEVACLAIAAIVVGYFAYYAIRLVWYSYKFHDISSGFDASPMWVPQSVMAIGVVGFLVSILEDLFLVLKTRRPVLRQADEIARVE